MKRQYALLLAFLALAVAPAFAQLGGFGGPDATPKASITGSIHTRSGDDVEGTIVAKIEDGWHVNSNKPTEEFAIPTVLELDAATAELTATQFPPHQMKAFEFTGGKSLAVFDGTFNIGFRAKLKPGATKIDAKLKFQACSDRVCLPPNVANATIDLATLTPAPAATSTTTAAPAASPNFTPLSSAPKDAVPQDRLARTFASNGLPLTLVILFLGGLALNLTPCVFPLIPITLGFFAMQSDGRRSRRFALSFMYVLGIVITYSALGVLASLSGKLFGAWLQNPIVLVAFAVMMLVLASSMFGAFEIQPPRWIANRSQGRAGLTGALIMGLVIGIVAAPCVGPVVISLIGLVAQLGDPVVGGVMFAALAFGLGFPYLIALNALPRPGEWMVTVKKGMGFVLIAMAFYFLRALIGDVAFQYGVAASLIIGAIFVFVSRVKGAAALRYAVAILLLIGGIAFAIPRKHESGVAWTKYDAKAIADARAAGKPVVIDFYADWCLPCKELDEKTFNDAKVIAELDRFVRVKADLTATTDAKTQELTKQYAILGVPTIVFIDAQGNEVRDARLTGFEPPDAFLQRAQRVK